MRGALPQFPGRFAGLTVINSDDDRIQHRYREGRRLPARVECTSPRSRACQAVGARVRALAIPASIGAIDAGEEPHTLRVLVGAWAAIRSAGHVQVIEAGPRASGVYARFFRSGAALTVLDAQGRTISVLGASHTPAALLLAAGQGLPYDLTDTISSLLFTLAFGSEQARLLERARARMEVDWGPAHRPAHPPARARAEIP